MTLTVMRNCFKKFRLRIISYRSYNHFSNEAYRESLISKLSQETFINNDDGFQRFCDISLATLNKHAECKKHVRDNQMPFFDTELSKAIMTRTKLHNNFLQNKSEQNRKLYAKQRHFCVSLLRKVKKRFFFLSGFSFTPIHESQDGRGRGRVFLSLLTATSTHFTDI